MIEASGTSHSRLGRLGLRAACGRFDLSDDEGPAGVLKLFETHAYGADFPG